MAKSNSCALPGQIYKRINLRDNTIPSCIKKNIENKYIRNDVKTLPWWLLHIRLRFSSLLHYKCTPVLFVMKHTGITYVREHARHDCRLQLFFSLRALARLQRQQEIRDSRKVSAHQQNQSTDIILSLRRVASSLTR